MRPSRVRRYFMDKFMVTITPMYKDHHIHGCNRAAMLRLTQDKTVCFEVKGARSSSHLSFVFGTPPTHLNVDCCVTCPMSYSQLGSWVARGSTSSRSPTSTRRC